MPPSMRCRSVLLVLGLVPFVDGCGELPLGSGLEIARYSSRNLYEAPVDARDDCMERAHDRHLGEKAFEEVCKANPNQTYSVHYRRGFVDGFADYLYAGGTGEPPVMPPWRYRRSTYETPEGTQAIQDWFAGFRAGAQTAQASGLRNLVLVPVSAVPPPTAPGMVVAPRPAESQEELPPPRKFMPPAGDQQ
jgi:hypothetical protein